MTSLAIAILSSLAGHAVLLWVYLHLYRLDREPYLRTWSIAWGASVVRSAVQLASVLTELTAVMAMAELAALASAWFLLAGSYQLRRAPMSRWWAAVFLAAAAWSATDWLWEMSFLLRTLPTFALLAMATAWTGVSVLRVKVAAGSGRRVTAWAFILWGVHRANYPLLRPVVWFAPFGYVLAATFELVAAIGMILVHLARTRASLKDSQKLVGDILDNSTALITVKDLQGRFLLVNRAFLEAFQVDRKQILGKTVHALLPDEKAKEVHQRDQELILGGRPQEFEDEVSLADGPHRFLALRFPLHDAEGNVFGLGGISTDITDRKRIDDRLHTAQKLEAIGTLAGGVAHDFNNLLTVISTQASLLKEQLPEGSTAADDVDVIREASNRAAALTRQLLAFSRRQVLRIRVLDPNEVVAGVGKMIQRLIGEDVELSVELGEGVGRVKADPAQLEQVMLNLAVNARDAMPEGGTLRISTSTTLVDEARERGTAAAGHYVQINVADDGEGMAEDTRQRAFEPFFTTKPPGKGTGLGLASVYGAVAQFGGFVEIDSQPGAGTRVRVYLPVFEGDPGDEADEEASAAPAASTVVATVLVVEDDPALRRLVVRSLRRAGHEVLEAPNGEEGVTAFGQHAGEIRVVVTDVVMPRLGGRSMVERIRRDAPDVKVLYLSGYPGQADDLDDPASAFLPKPFEPNELTRRVNELLAR